MKRISKSRELQCVIKTSPLGFLLDQRHPIHGEQHIIHPEELGTFSVLPHKIYEFSWPLNWTQKGSSPTFYTENFIARDHVVYFGFVLNFGGLQ